ncbi:erythrocyte membrane protein 1 [Plasmodium falciparum RAJ116]|uniref:Erythrocyte membrane protein 1 n=1 Tax=Plasmodium falciparum RAJ116 TaxID=580058 RepID=A0A0L0CUC9_PLAFA|nr:erythrocyte membrane protein 1 [Plasmodium falciparum RAJ116]
MATGSGGDSSRDESVKHLFDRIGKKVYEKTEKIAKRYTTELHGDLSKASYPNDENPEGSTENNPCKLQYDYNTNVTHGFGQEYPCETDIVERFSDKEGAQCTDQQIEGNDRNNGGACAPYRRLNLCVRNLQNISHINKINNKHNLLVEVCLAAKHEGDSITGRYPQYQATYGDVGSTMCTMLARSFADIGDIIRGKDLYRGNKKEKKKRDELENNLKKIFGDIYNELTTTNGVKSRYNGDEDNNFFKLREDWWTANRETVWKAITCNAGSYQYSQPTCSEEPLSQQKCSCPNAGVPTNFDYVPQYLRWFEEWGEDFCRKKKKKIPNVKTNCRQVEEGKEKYCTVGGYNCEGTIRKQYIYRLDTDCTKCSLACKTFAEWIDNQKHQFDKQVKKYTNEISGGDGRRQKRSTHSTKEYKGYEKHFNEELRNEGKDVRSFLQLLSKEKICKERIQVGEETANYGNFENESNTFSHTEYCEPCPMCGVDCSSGNCIKKEENTCNEETTEKVYPDSNTTKIPKLTAEKRKRGILKKYEKFCQKNEENDQIKNWECHYEKKNEEDENDESGDSNNCILGEWKTFKNERNPISYYSFFYGSIIDMLNDSIEWREGLKKCLQNDKKDCISKCNSRCDCYKRWVDKKKTEWTKIKEHFLKQEDMRKDIGKDTDPGKFLEFYLKSNFLDDMTKAHADTKVIEKFREILGKENEDGLPNFSNEKRIIEEFLNGEQKKAEDCLNTHTKDDCPKVESPLRSDTSHDGPQSPAPNHEEHELSDDEDDDDDDEEHGTTDDHQDEEGKAPDGEVEPPKETTKEVNPCQIVQTLFGDKTNLEKACTQKYGKNNSRLGWKCIPTGNTSNDNKGESSGKGDGAEAKIRTARSTPDKATTSSSNTGAICIPPRRRKLYIDKIKKWAEKQTQPQEAGAPQVVSGEGKVGTESQSSSSSSSSPPSNLRAGDVGLVEAFVESAAVETFFLWDRYKKLNAPQSGSSLGGLGGAGALAAEYGIPSGSEETTPDLQEQLLRGDIPTYFLRLMFYTLADYRDILFGNTGIVVEALSSSDKENMQKIQEKIQQILPKNGGTSLVPKPGTTTPESWWQTHGPDIWNGMICALTYKENGAKDTPPTQDEEVKKALLDGEGKKPQKHQYEYETVELKEENETGARSGSSLNPETTKLENFVVRPTFFRYLEEWGGDFCDTRKHLLEKIYKDCEVEENGARGAKKENPKCSGYGEHCEYNLLNKSYDTLLSLYCPRCATSCRFYRKWIRRKKDEYEKQQKAYEQQKKGAQGNSGIYDEKFVKKLDSDYKNIKSFLQKLVSCSKNDSGKDNEKIFEDTEQTFKDAENCKPCSKFKTDCKSGKCDKTKGQECQSKTHIEAKDIKNGGNSSEELDMLVSDNSTTEFNGLEACQTSGIFKGIRKEQWTCGNVCGYNVCKPKNSEGKKVSGERNGENQIILITAFVKHWVENFLEDYNNVKHKISHCIKNGENKCINGCNKKCTCVEQWINLKKGEWDIVKKLFIEQYKGEKSDEYYYVRSFLESFIPQITDVNEKEKVIKISKFDNSCGCSADASAQKNDGHKDAIDCMLKNLQEKAKKCEKDPPTCYTLPQSGENSTLVEDDDDPLEEENPEENTVDPPKICPKVEEQKEVEDGTCDAVTPKTVTDENEKKDKDKKEEKSPEAAEAPTETNNTESQTPKDTKPLAPPAPKHPRGGEEKKAKPSLPNPPKVDNPSFQTALMSPTLMWSVGISFAALTYWLLKKKTKSPVDMLRVLQIPQNDYGIPTLKSTNRYIPYASGKYRGKRYIYLEGDSGTDSGYTDHYSDITSSESEYEEMDINDIYVPGSPKYKTLIEVVLEPSKRDTSNKSSGTKDTQNITPSDTPRNKPINDVEWNQLKKNFISKILQNPQNDLPQNNISTDTSINIHPDVSILHDSMEEKPFVTSIHDRDLQNGEEVTYNINLDDHKNMNVSTNHDNIPPKNNQNDLYTGIDLINDSISGNHNVDIYDELLKRKENELFGTNHTKHTTTNSVAKQTHNDPIVNQINLFHKWLDRHRNMCEQWDKNKKEELLDKLKEEWEQDYNNNSGDIHNRYENVLNTDVSIQINMNDPKPINEFTNMDTNPDNFIKDTILDDLDKHPETYFYDIYDDDITYFDIDDEKTPMGDINVDNNNVNSNNMDVPNKVHIEMNIINNKKEIFEEKYPISDIWNI